MIGRMNILHDSVLNKTVEIQVALHCIHVSILCRSAESKAKDLILI